MKTIKIEIFVFDLFGFKNFNFFSVSDWDRRLTYFEIASVFEISVFEKNLTVVITILEDLITFMGSTFNHRNL